MVEFFGIDEFFILSWYVCIFMTDTILPDCRAAGFCNKASALRDVTFGMTLIYVEKLEKLLKYSLALQKVH